MTGMSPRSNVDMKVDGSKLVITIELKDVAQEKSKSGKSWIVATTGGNVQVPGEPEFRLGLNLYVPV